jgi:hypothetical protein
MRKVSMRIATKDPVPDKRNVHAVHVWNQLMQLAATSRCATQNYVVQQDPQTNATSALGDVSA